MKKCTKCKNKKKHENFYKDASKSDGYESICKDCKKKYYKENKIKISENDKKRRIKNKDKISEQRKKYYKESREYILEKRKEYYEANREDILNKQKKSGKERYERNKEEIIRKEREKYHNMSECQKDKIRKRKREYRRKRLKEDINYRLSSNMRSRLCNVLSGRIKHGSTFELVGCDIEELKLYLETQFKEGMSWDNYGSWHVDHIIPCCKFNMESEEEQRECFHYTNLQPLWANENISKGGS